MYAIARIAGKQFRIEPDRDIKVPRLDVKEGSTFTIEEILFTTDGKKAKIPQWSAQSAPQVKPVHLIQSHAYYFTLKFLSTPPNFQCKKLS